MDNDRNTVSEETADEKINIKPPYRAGRLYGKMTWIFSAVAVMMISASLIAAFLNLAIVYYAPAIAAQKWYTTALSGVSYYVFGAALAGIMLLLSVPDGGIPSAKKISFGKFMKYLCVTMAFVLIGARVGDAVTWYIGKVVGHPIVNPVETALDGASWIASSIVMIIAAPIIEELIFRKLLIDRISPFGEKTAIFASALAFGLVHGNFSQFFYAFAIGLLFGYIYVKTRNILYTIALHMFVNGFCGVLSGYITSKIDTDAIKSISEALENASEEEAPQLIAELAKYTGPVVAQWILSLATLGLAIAGIVFFIKGVKNVSLEKSRFDISAGNVRVAAYLNVGIIILYAVMTLSFIASLELQPEGVIAGAIIVM